MSLSTRPKSHRTARAGVAGLLAMILLLVSCGPQPEDAAAAATAREADAHFVDLTRQEYRAGALSMRIQAHEASWYEDEQRLEIRGLSFITYSADDGSVAATGEADRAVFHETSGDAEFSGYVRLVSADGAVSFETSRIDYKRALDIFETPEGTDVTIEAKQQLVMAGTGLLFDVKQKYYEIRNSVSGSVYQ